MAIQKQAIICSPMGGNYSLFPAIAAVRLFFYYQDLTRSKMQHASTYTAQKQTG